MIDYQPVAGGIIEPAHTLSVDGDYDVVVVGGGIAGVGAGIAAARSGCKTLLIESTSTLGGLVTLGLVNIPLDFLSGIGQEMFRDLIAVNGLWHRNTDPEKHKLVLDRMVKRSGCEVLLTTYVVDVLMQEGKICGVVVESKAGRKAIKAKRVIDSSGDGDVVFFAGAETMYGRKEDGYVQACSLEFRLGGVDWDLYMSSDLKENDPKWIDLIERARGDGDSTWMIENHMNWITHVPGRPEHCGMDEVSLCFAHSRKCKPLDNRDLTRMYQEGREQADSLWRFIKKYVPGFASCWLVDTGALLGIRDSRRVLGEYVITGMDIACGRHFDDVVTISAHGYDVHNPVGVGNIKWIEAQIDGQTRYVIGNRSGFGTSWDPPGGKQALCDYMGRSGDAMQFPEPNYYDIPYRCLVPVKVENLLVAGRCLSADFEAQSGSRLIMACMSMGEAAGTASALSLKYGISPRKIDYRELQQMLLKFGGNLGEAFDRSTLKQES